MDRAEKIGLGAAVAAHAVLFAVLSFGLLKPEEPPRREVVEVTLSEDVGLTATTTDRPAPAASQSEPFESLPDLMPERIRPTPTPTINPAPQPRSRPTPRPQPTPERTRPRDTPRTQPTPRRAEPSGPVDRRNRRRPDRLNGITSGIETTNNTGTSSSNATVSSSDRSNLISRIVNAVRPCYNLGPLSGTAAEDIVVRLRVRPSRNGSLSGGQVNVLGYDGVNASNREYQRQMGEAARSAVLNPRCPFPDLPDNMYENGWSDVTLRFIPAQLT